MLGPRIVVPLGSANEAYGWRLVRPGNENTYRGTRDRGGTGGADVSLQSTPQYFEAIHAHTVRLRFANDRSPRDERLRRRFVRHCLLKHFRC